MKKRLILLFPLVFMSLIVSCDIASPYIDAILVKIDEDSEGMGVAPIRNLNAAATAFDPADTNRGTILISWDNPAVDAGQTEPVFLYIRVGEGSDPPGTSGGAEVYHGVPTVGSVSFPDVQLNIIYHFVAWTQDSEGNLSEPVSVQGYISKSEINLLYDGFIKMSDSSKDFSSTELLVGDDGTYSLFTAIRFADFTIDNIIRADLLLYLNDTSTSVSTIELAMFNENWNSSDTYGDILNLGLSATHLGYYTHTSGIYNRWNVTTEIANRGDAEFGFGMAGYETYSDTASFSSSEGSNPPRLEIYYGSE